jgi:uncharacterized protein YaiL (DUF2058 family)
MSTSLRDQMLKAGLVNKKQVSDAERQLQRQERHPPQKLQAKAPAPQQARQSAKAARDQELNRRHRDKAEHKARLAQIKQLVEQNRIAPSGDGEPYNFVDGSKIRRIAVDAAIRDRLGRGEITIVRHADGYDLVPMAIAARVGERDSSAVIRTAASGVDVKIDEAYQAYAVPDDLIW